MRQKDFVWVGLLAVLLSTILFPFTSQAMVRQASLDLSAHAAVLIDVESGRILFEKNSTQKMRIASITKILTAIVAIEQGELSDRVKTSPRAYGTEGSSIFLKRGEEMSLHHLLYGLMLRSGNDAAVAIAEHVGGSLEGFVYLMNEKAQLIGMKDSRFANPHGLDDSDQHYSTARDMALLTAYALKNPMFREIVQTKIKTAPSEGDPWDRKWYNKNKMLSMYDGADGVKTGYTKLAKRTLSSSATREGVQLAAVTLNAPNDWMDHRKMLDYGFEQFDLVTLVEKGEKVHELKGDEDPAELVASFGFQYALANEERDQVEKKLVAYPEDSVEVKTGVLARLEFYLDGERIGQVPLVEKGSPRLSLVRTHYTFQPYDWNGSIWADFRHVFETIWRIWLVGTRG
jgi:D-alanyl-D-alanine carboxypeptidase (penicillin-binding protein 5/6)